MQKHNFQKKTALTAADSEIKMIEFALGDTLYAIDIASVREIIRADIAIAKVPYAHESIEGAINLRGQIIPVINMAKLLSKECALNQKDSRIIISAFSNIPCGFLVSAVYNIHRVPAKDIEPGSQLLHTQEVNTAGVAKIEGKILLVVDFERLLAKILPEARQ
ncbi:MAG: purine-binding chemotaxis protein CheW [Candidatus Omnitrophica bacterium]|nr:purine-binding chemotaxis protein CheW [Candidatus Omnitrophota bacterium]